MTEVWFDSKALPFAQLLQRGLHADCAQRVWTTTAAQLAVATAKVHDRAQRLEDEPRVDKEPQYYLRQTAWRHVPMTAAQATRCNAALAPKAKSRAEQWLSPRQLEWFERVQSNPKRDWPVAAGQPLAAAWTALTAAGSRRVR